MKSFADNIKRQSGDNYIVKTYDAENKPCWFLLKASDIKIKKLRHTSSDEIINLTQYGEVLDSGWGHEPIIKPQ